MVVKTVYRNYPVDMLNESQLAWDESIALQTKTEDVKLQAVKFLDLKEKPFFQGPQGKPNTVGELSALSLPMSIYSLLQASTYITMCVQVLLVLKMFGKLKSPFTANLLGWWALCLPMPTWPNAIFRRALRNKHLSKWSLPMPWFHSRSQELLDQETAALKALQIKVNIWPISG